MVDATDFEEESSEKISSKISNKRYREETSDSETDVPLKKSRSDKLANEKESNCDKTKEDVTNFDSNNPKEGNIDHNKDISNQSKANNVHDGKDESIKMDDTDSTKPIMTEEKDSEEKKNDDTQSNKQDLEGQTDTKDSSIDKDESEKVIKRTNRKKKNEETEIINGVELTVECASDENSSEESEKEENVKPRPKTKIVHEQPNEFEVDASSSEAENSDSYKIIESKSNIKSIPAKHAKQKGRNKSSTKNVASESEPNTEDEDITLDTKKKVKKPPSPKKTTEIKRGRGRPPKNSIKSTKELTEDESEKKEETSSHETEKQKDTKSAETKVVDNDDSKTEDSENEESDEKSNNDNNKNKDVEKEKNRKPSTRNLKKIENFKKFIRATGIRVSCYATLLKDCQTDAAKAKYLAEFLHEHGVVGRPTLEKCEKIRKKNETIKEISELDTSNIISETRLTRGRNARKSHIETKIAKTASSPDDKVTESYNRIKAVVDSDSE